MQEKFVTVNEPKPYKTLMKYLFPAAKHFYKQLEKGTSEAATKLEIYSEYLRLSNHGVIFKDILQLGSPKNYLLRYKEKALFLENIVDCTHELKQK